MLTVTHAVVGLSAAAILATAATSEEPIRSEAATDLAALTSAVDPSGAGILIENIEPEPHPNPTGEVPFGTEPSAQRKPRVLLADVNGDGVIDARDIMAMLSQWGSCTAPTAHGCTGDLNGDGRVSDHDLLFLIQQWQGA